MSMGSFALLYIHFCINWTSMLNPTIIMSLLVCFLFVYEDGWRDVK